MFFSRHKLDPYIIYSFRLFDDIFPCQGKFVKDLSEDIGTKYCLETFFFTLKKVPEKITAGIWNQSKYVWG